MKRSKQINIWLDCIFLACRFYTSYSFSRQQLKLYLLISECEQTLFDSGSVNIINNQHLGDLFLEHTLPARDNIALMKLSLSILPGFLLLL